MSMCCCMTIYPFHNCLTDHIKGEVSLGQRSINPRDGRVQLFVIYHIQRGWLRLGLTNIRLKGYSFMGTSVIGGHIVTVSSQESWCTAGQPDHVWDHVKLKLVFVTKIYYNPKLVLYRKYITYISAIEVVERHTPGDAEHSWPGLRPTFLQGQKIIHMTGLKGPLRLSWRSV